MRRPTAPAAREFARILSKYDLGSYLGSKRLTARAVETNYKIKTTCGVFVFRRYENRSINSVRFEIDLLNYLKTKAFPCPAPMSDKQGSFIGVQAGRPFVIFTFCAGRPLKHPGISQRRELIRNVAELHNLTQRYIPRYRKYRLNYDIPTCRKLARQAAKDLGTADARRKLAWFERELRQLRLPTSLPKGICHCDFHFSNVLYKQGRLSALLDFDDANYTFLTYDLACLADPFRSDFNWNTWRRFGKNSNVFDFKQAAKTVKEYSKWRKIGKQEREHFFDVFKLSVMFDCIWYFARGNSRDFFERRKIDYIDAYGKDNFGEAVFGGTPD